MENINAKCVSTVNRKREVFRENKSKLTLINTDESEAQRIIVDGCAITEGKKCDFMYIINDKEIYIELKGSDITKAFVQLEATINKLSTCAKSKKKISFVICTKCPLAASDIMSYRKKFRANFNCDLLVKGSPFEFNV
jgi:hypothetical protein